MAKYEIGTGNSITFKIGDIEIVQPAWPDGTKWKSKTEAETWAKLYVAHLDDETAPRPGNGPDEKVLEISALERTAEEVKADEEYVAAQKAELEAAAKAVEEAEATPAPLEEDAE